jgi:NAD(P)-dependent dehydrogenase (short-subunit alcohol dehydrogenase family)
VEIKDAVAVVTGGASGLGLATTKRLLDRGASVVVIDLKGEDAVSELGERAQFVETNVTDPDAVSAALDAAEKIGPLRINVNCAGIGNAIKTLGKDGPFPLDGFKKVIEVNLIGTFNGLRLGAAAIAKTEPVDEFGSRGVVINTASVAALEGQTGQIAYSSSKGGIVGMTVPAARDLAAIGVRVNTVCPGIIDTPIYGQGEQAEEFKKKLVAPVVFPKRMGRPSEFAHLVRSLIENDYVNAEVIRFDGGIRFQPK